MAGIFEEVRLSWEGREYVIPPSRILRVIAAIEEHITLGELLRAHERGTAPLGKLSMAFAAALRLAGAQVSDEQVYMGMFGDARMQAAVGDAISTLLIMMVPPGAMKKAVEKAKQEAAQEEQQGGKEQATSSS